MDEPTMILLEKYLNKESLSESETALLAQLKETGELKKQLVLMQDFMSATEVWGSQMVKKQMEEWSFEQEVEDMRQQGGQQASDDGGGTIPEATLHAFFAEAPAYSSAVHATNRNIGLLIENTSKKDSNGFEWDQSIMNFLLRLESPLDTPLKFQIEDNLQDILHKGALELKDATFSISFDWEKAHPGRYYLKFFTDKHLRILEFFIGKDLMP